MDPKKRTAAITAIVLAIASAPLAYGIYTDDEAKAERPALELDAGDEAATLTTDLRSPPVPPGKLVVDGVNLPEGYEVVGEPELTGDAIGAFEIEGQKQHGQAFQVVAQNTSGKELRFTAVIHYARSSPP